MSNNGVVIGGTSGGYLAPLLLVGTLVVGTLIAGVFTLTARANVQQAQNAAILTGAQAEAIVVKAAVETDRTRVQGEDLAAGLRDGLTILATCISMVVLAQRRLSPEQAAKANASGTVLNPAIINISV